VAPRRRQTPYHRWWVHLILYIPSAFKYVAWSWRLTIYSGVLGSLLIFVRQFFVHGVKPRNPFQGAVWGRNKCSGTRYLFDTCSRLRIWEYHGAVYIKEIVFYRYPCIIVRWC
jgi:hypothetical protein